MSQDGKISQILAIWVILVRLLIQHGANLSLKDKVLHKMGRSHIAIYLGLSYQALDHKWS